MADRTKITKTLGRWIAALVASFAVTLLGLYKSPQADTVPALDCSLSDVAVWQAALNDPQEELSPAYLLSVTQAFLEACPNRPEIPTAHQIAGRAAADDGNPELAVTHFEQAGWMPDLQSQFAFAGALLADGQDRRAWDLLDASVESWLYDLSRRDHISVEQTPVQGGTIYSLKGFRSDKDYQIATAWTAVPHGPGWPATLSIGKDRQITAFRQLRAGPTPGDDVVVDLYRCQGRRILAKFEATLSEAEMDEAAKLALISYLNAPDTQTASGTMICLWPRRLLPYAQR